MLPEIKANFLAGQKNQVIEEEMNGTTERPEGKRLPPKNPTFQALTSFL